MATSEIVYTGGLRTQVTHLRSGQTIITDAPIDNHGKGEAFSPTDLMATSLGICAITVVGIAADTHGFSVDGARITVTKLMADSPRRIGEIVVEFEFPKVLYTDKQKDIITRTIRTCPVSLSLHPDVKQTISIHFQD